MSNFVILGIHGSDVPTVEGNSARVRMYIGDKEVDEDFILPEIPRSIPTTVEVYHYFLTEAINKRMAELEAPNV